MKKLICPICERELTSVGYCRLCKKIVLKPIVRNVDYYLNETRKDDRTLLNQKPMSEEKRLETGLEKDIHEKMAEMYQSVRKQVDSISGSSKPDNSMFDSSQSTSRKSPGRLEGSKKKLGFLSVLIVIILCIAAVNLFTYISGTIFVQVRQNLFSKETVLDEDTVDSDSAELSDEGESTFTELDEETVKSSGIRCDGETHFSCSFDAADTRLNEVFDQLGLQVEAYDDSENYSVDSGEYTYSFYDSYRYYSIFGDNEEGLSVLLNYDTVTGEVHSLSIRASYPERNDTAAEILRQMADFVSEKEGTVTKEEILSAITADDYIDKSEYNYYIYGYDYEGITAGLDSYYDWDDAERLEIN